MRARRRRPRIWVRTWRAMRPASPMPISPAATALQTRCIGCCCGQQSDADPEMLGRVAGAGRRQQRHQKRPEQPGLAVEQRRGGLRVSPVRVNGQNAPLRVRDAARPARGIARRSARADPSRAGARLRAREAEKDQDQVVEIPQFRFRNAAKSSEAAADGQFRASAGRKMGRAKMDIGSCYVPVKPPLPAGSADVGL